MYSKITIDELCKVMNSEGYTLLSTRYVGNKSKLSVKCPNGHIYKTSWFNWNTNGSRCPKCSKTGVRLNYSYVNSLFTKEDYTLISDVYINNKQKLKTICPNGHEYYTTLNNWRIGSRCKLCRQEITDQEIIEDFNKNGMTILNKLPIKRSKILYTCANNHKNYVSLSDWKRSTKQCPICIGYFSRDIKYIRKELLVEDYILLSDSYTPGSASIIKYKCPRGHINTMRYYHWTRGLRCKKCSNNISKFENEVKYFIKKLNYCFKANDRTQLINPNTGRFLELDLYFKNLNKAIECNGVYWHSSPERESIDNIKKELCKKYGIELLIVNDIDWKNNNLKTKSDIINFLSNGEVVYE